MAILVHEPRHSVCVAVPKASLLACRIQLYEQGLCVQEILSQFLRLIENKDPRAVSIIQTAKNSKIANVRTKLIITNARTLYAALQRHSPFHDTEEDGEENGRSKEGAEGER